VKRCGRVPPTGTRFVSFFSFTWSPWQACSRSKWLTLEYDCVMSCRSCGAEHFNHCAAGLHPLRKQTGAAASNEWARCKQPSDVAMSKQWMSSVQYITTACTDFPSVSEVDKRRWGKLKWRRQRVSQQCPTLSDRVQVWNRDDGTCYLKPQHGSNSEWYEN